jgi:hypothetical protein
MKSWLSCAAAGALWVSLMAGCANGPPATACVPSCREGFTCVAGSCVSSCNPACAQGERCDTSGGRARCASADAGTDAGSSSDGGSSLADSASVEDSGNTGSDAGAGAMDGASSPLDAGAMDSALPTGDSGAPRDASVGTDAGSLTDAGALTDARPACGMPGQPCCGRYCAYGSTCEVPTGSSTGTCQMFAPAMGECVGPTTCAAANNRCRVGVTCGDRRCILCTPNLAGATRPLGAACANTDECESGFCFGSKCSTLCTPGAAGDATCAGLLPRGVCGGGTSSATVPAGDGGVARSSVLSFGACRASCGRDADCAAGDVCGPSTNEGADRVDFLCRSAGAGLAGGAACTMASQCASGSCVFSGPTGTCFQNCATAADCPASAPMCVDINWNRPSGGTQPGRTCAPR